MAYAGALSSGVFIGLPVRNGAGCLRTALDSVLAQTYQDWRLLVSDNQSVDMTRDIVQEYASRDSRISLLRQPADIGAIANFVYCARACPAEAQYFAWFAHDDIWQPEFLSAAISRLGREPDAGFAWANVYALDTYGQYQGVATDYSRYAGRGTRAAMRFVLEHETCGKAMLIYSVFRRNLVHSALDVIPADYREALWDNVFNLACLARGALTVDRRHLFGKRAPRQGDAPGHFEPWRISFDRTLGLSVASWRAYFDAMRAVVAGTSNETILTALIAWRRYTRQYLVPRAALAASDISVD
jgi:glycosyltransferase involved in cell wall biosynthesis